jgi:hypothetical protein
MSYPDLPQLPELIEHLREHFKTCWDCYKVAAQIKSAKPQDRLAMITKIHKMHENTNKIQTKVLGVDIRVHLRIPHRLWDECKDILAANKIKISQYVVTAETLKGAKSLDAERQDEIKAEGKAFVEYLKDKEEPTLDRLKTLLASSKEGNNDEEETEDGATKA